MRICLVYDCLYPYTVGGAERWYRNLGERLAAEGHEVTLLTLRQWPRGQRAEVEGVRVLTAGPRMELYVDGRRRILPPVVFGAGVLWHLLVHGGRYDVVHTASFPYFSLLAAAVVRPLRRFRLVVDWHEVWTRDYWREYLGRVGGAIGWWVQRRCARVRQRAFAFSRLHAARLRDEGLWGEVSVLEGEYRGSLEPQGPASAEPVVVFAGRHIPEKRVAALVPAITRARAAAPELRCDVYGDGPDRPALELAVREQGLEDVVRVHGFVDSDTVDRALRYALCMALPSRREGYGLVVIEAASVGTPSVVVAGPDNAAVELVEDGVNGVVAPSASPEDLAAAILRVREAGPALRESTAAWFAANAPRLSLESSLREVVRTYAAESA
ncbi:MAG: glycosyltransferase family 4 protein [Actinomycetota bacterium]|nr:glycosyltransferase family 4 protein [Actinomycetota bacterium]